MLGPGGAVDEIPLLEQAFFAFDEQVTRWGDPVPPMFWLRDPDGNSLIIVQPSA